MTLKPSAMLLYISGLACSKISKMNEETYLFTALDNIKGADSGVGNTAGEDSTSHTLHVVGGVVIISSHFYVFSFSTAKVFSLIKTIIIEDTRSIKSIVTFM